MGGKQTFDQHATNVSGVACLATSRKSRSCFSRVRPTSWLTSYPTLIWARISTRKQRSGRTTHTHMQPRTQLRRPKWPTWVESTELAVSSWLTSLHRAGARAPVLIWRLGSLSNASAHWWWLATFKIYTSNELKAVLFCSTSNSGAWYVLQIAGKTRGRWRLRDLRRLTYGRTIRPFNTPLSHR